MSGQHSPPIAANATNAVGLSLSCFTAAAADWRRRPSWDPSFSWLLGINIVGGAIGAFLMLGTPGGLLIRLVPVLVGGATLLFAVGPWIQRHLPSGRHAELHFGRVAFPIFLSSIYGGYFGAGIGVINLAILSIGGLTDFRSTNVLKNILITGVCASSAWVYVWQGAVVWPAMVALMGCCSPIDDPPLAPTARRRGEWWERRDYCGARYRRRLLCQSSRIPSLSSYPPPPSAQTARPCRGNASECLMLFDLVRLPGPNESGPAAG